MGLFDRFKKKNVKENNIEQEEEYLFEPTVRINPDGTIQIDFYDEEADFKQFYDTTRLIIDARNLDLPADNIHRCRVSWYKEDDAQMLDEKTGKVVNLDSIDYKEIIAGIDLFQLQDNIDYCKIVMKDLLEKKRVERYIEAGMQETPELPCGNYIGGVQKTENGFRKVFNKQVGEACHNSVTMVNRRREYREEKEAARQRAITAKEEQIRKLQEELEDLSR